MNSFSRLTVLSDAEIEKIKSATERIVETTGVCVRHEGLLKKAARAGARVDAASGRVRLPAPLFRELLSQVPPRVRLRGMLDEGWVMGGDEQRLLSIVSDPWIIDYETQRPRRPCLEDVRRHTFITQRLEPVVAVSRMDFPVTDVEDATSSLRALEVHLLNHVKHYLVLPATLESFEQWMQIGRILSRGEPLDDLITVGVAVASPWCSTS